MKITLSLLILALLAVSAPVRAQSIPIIFGAVIAPIIIQSNIAGQKARKIRNEKDWQNMLAEQSQPGLAGSTHITDQLHTVEEEGEPIVILSTRSNQGEVRAAHIQCIGTDPQISFFLGSPEHHLAAATEHNLWTAADQQEKHQFPETRSTRGQYFAPVLKGAAARQASLDILQPDSSFGDSAGLKVWVSQDHDFAQALSSVPCLQ